MDDDRRPMFEQLDDLGVDMAELHRRREAARACPEPGVDQTERQMDAT
ncbi:hypothetical protein [Pararhizobium sp.]